MASTGALIEIINGPDIDQYVDTVKKFLARVLQLHSLMEQKLDEDDMDDCLQICNLLVATLQANMKSLMSVTEEDDSSQQDISASLTMLLVCILYIRMCSCYIWNVCVYVCLCVCCVYVCSLVITHFELVITYLCIHSWFELPYRLCM